MERPAIPVVGGVALALLLVCGIALVVFAVTRPPDVDHDDSSTAVVDDDSELLPDEPEERSVGGLTFVWPHRLRDVAVRWTEVGEPIAVAAASVLESSVVPRRSVILVDTPENTGTEGHASAESVVLDVVGHPGWRTARTFAHEFAHVAQLDLSRAAIAAHEPLLDCFREGSAEWIAYEVLLAAEAQYLDAAEREALTHARWAARFIAAVLVERHGIALDTLFDQRAYRSRYDSLSRYGLGELLAEAVARACDRRAIGGLLRAASAAPGGATGWANASLLLQTIGCDSRDVEREWDALISSQLEARRVDIEAIPRATAALVRDADGLEFVEISFDRAVPRDATVYAYIGPPTHLAELGSAVPRPDRGAFRPRFWLPRSWVEAWREPDTSVNHAYYVSVLVTLERPDFDLRYSEPWAYLEDTFAGPAGSEGSTGEDGRVGEGPPSR